VSREATAACSSASVDEIHTAYVPLPAAWRPRLRTTQVEVGTVATLFITPSILRLGPPTVAWGNTNRCKSGLNDARPVVAPARVGLIHTRAMVAKSMNCRITRCPFHRTHKYRAALWRSSSSSYQSSAHRATRSDARMLAACSSTLQMESKYYCATGGDTACHG